MKNKCLFETDDDSLTTLEDVIVTLGLAWMLTLDALLSKIWR